jgi:flagellar export protein FliJ
MPKFSFRLQKVLEYREMEEGAAKDLFVAAQNARGEKQGEIRRLIEYRSGIVTQPANTLDARIHLERVMERIDDEERAQRAALAILENEEASAQTAWNLKRQAVKAIEKLRESALDQWKLDEERREQASLDEWAVLRRAS